MLVFLDRISTESYPDIIAIICIPVILAILTIAFPLLTHSRNKVKEQYKSRSIAEQFDKEISNVWLKRLLIISLLSVLIWLLQFPAPYIENKFWSDVIDNSAVILLIISSSLLVFYLFKLISLLNKYHNPDKLIKRLERCFKKKTSKRLVPISELFYYSIREEDEVLSKYIITFLNDNIEHFKSDESTESVIYIPEFYDLVYYSNIEIAKQTKKLSSIFNNLVMLDYIVKDLRNRGISEEAYYCIWHSLLQLIFYDNQEMIYSYWSSAHQVLVFHQNDFEYNNFLYSENINNTPQIERFKEFHYLLGALLLYSEKYKLLSKCIRFTHSQPSRYVLVPNDMEDLINEYTNLKTGVSSPIYYQLRFTFPELTGVAANDYIIMWLNRYFAILFIRQYQMKYEYTVSYDCNNLPSLDGKNNEELVHLRNRMEVMKRNVEYYLDDSNREILKELGLDDFNKGYLLNKETPPNPIEDLSTYISNIKNKIDEVKITQELSESKIGEFKEVTKKVISNTLNDIGKALNTQVVREDEIIYPNYIGRSKRDILSKGGFVDNQDILYFNSTSITAKGLASDIKYNFSVSFGRAVKKSYSVYRDSLFDALDKLELNENHIIAAIGLNVEMVAGYYSKKSKIEKESDNIYFLSNKRVRIAIITLSSISFESLNNSLIVLKKSDLPYLKKHDVDNKLKEKYKLEEIDDTNMIYGSIIDLNKDNNIKEEVLKVYSGNEVLDESVLSTVSVSYELRWKKDACATQIQVFSPYETKGDITVIDDIKPIN